LNKIAQQKQMQKLSDFRILTFSNNLFIVQTRFLFFFWMSEDEQFNSLSDAKAYIENLKILQTRPKLVDIAYID